MRSTEVDPADLAARLLEQDPEPARTDQLPAVVLPGVGGDGLSLGGTLRAGGVGLLVVLSLLNLLDYAGQRRAVGARPRRPAPPRACPTPGSASWRAWPALTFVVGADPAGRARRPGLAAPGSPPSARRSPPSPRCSPAPCRRRGSSGPPASSPAPGRPASCRSTTPCSPTATRCAAGRRCSRCTTSCRALGYVVGPLLAGAVAAAAGGRRAGAPRTSCSGCCRWPPALAALLLREPAARRGRPRGRRRRRGGRAAAGRPRGSDPPVALGPAVAAAAGDPHAVLPARRRRGAGLLADQRADLLRPAARARLRPRRAPARLRRRR